MRPTWAHKRSGTSLERTAKLPLNATGQPLRWRHTGSSHRGDDDDRSRIQIDRAHRVFEDRNRGCREQGDRQGFEIDPQYSLVPGERPAWPWRWRQGTAMASNHEGRLHTRGLSASLRKYRWAGKDGEAADRGSAGGKSDEKDDSDHERCRLPRADLLGPHLLDAVGAHALVVAADLLGRSAHHREFMDAVACGDHRTIARLHAARWIADWICPVRDRGASREINHDKHPRPDCLRHRRLPTLKTSIEELLRTRRSKATRSPHDRRVYRS